MKSASHSYKSQILPYMPELRRAALRYTGSEAGANDLLQETLMRAWTGWSGFSQGTNARAWVHRILRNTFINHYRRNKREREVLLQAHGIVRSRRSTATMPEPFGLSYGDEVAQALARLPYEFRQAVEMVDEEGQSYQEAARRLGCPVGTVMSRLHRGRKQLRKSLQGYAEGEGILTARAA